MSTLVRGFTLGVVAGLRSVLAPALLARAISTEGPDIADGGWVLDVLAHRRVALVLGLGTLPEFVIDKLPAAKSRLLPPLLAARVISGGTTAAIHSLAEGGRSDQGAVVGSLGAVVGSVAGYCWRTRMPGPPLLLALVEDAVALALGFWSVRR